MFFDNLLTEPTAIMELNFPSIPDEKIPIGTYVILWNEIPVKKIGPNLYEVYDIPVVKVESFEDRMEKFIFALGNDEPLHNFIPPNVDPLFCEPTTKYKKTSKGMKRVKPWESSGFY